MNAIKCWAIKLAEMIRKRFLAEFDHGMANKRESN